MSILDDVERNPARYKTVTRQTIVNGERMERSMNIPVELVPKYMVMEELFEKGDYTGCKKLLEELMKEDIKDEKLKRYFQEKYDKAGEKEYETYLETPTYTEEELRDGRLNEISEESFYTVNLEEELRKAQEMAEINQKMNGIDPNKDISKADENPFQLE